MTDDQPALHHPIPMQSRVLVPLYFKDMRITNRIGTVTGIASAHVITTYNVTLDAPMNTVYGLIHCITVHGHELERLDGSNWRKK